MHKEFDLGHIFSYHDPTEEQKQSYQDIRAAASLLASTILLNTPECADQTVAIRKLREAVMMANAAIALGGRLTQDVLDDEDMVKAKEN